MKLNELVWIILIAFTILFFPRCANSRMIKVAVIDTGFNPKYRDKVKLCPTGHKDFTGEGLLDRTGHGTHISGLIEDYSQKKVYCQIILKYYISNSPSNTIKYMVESIQRAIELNVDIINISSSGNKPDVNEYMALERALNKNIKVVVAAGNEGVDLSKYCNSYPACYKDNRLIVVGNIDSKGSIAPSSNYGGVVKAYVTGVAIKGLNGVFTGTSQSTAIYTGNLISKMSN